MNIARVLPVVALVAILNFGYFAAPLVSDIWNAYQSTSWPQTSGHVTRVVVVRPKTGRYKGHDFAEVSYSYTVQGHVYQSDRVAFFGSGEIAAQTVIERYPVGKSLPVFFNPSEPSEAVLIPGITSKIPLIILGIGTLVVATGLTLLLSVILRVRRVRDST